MWKTGDLFKHFADWEICKMDEIMQIAKAHDIRVLEDACQADGGSYKGERFSAKEHQRQTHNKIINKYLHNDKRF